MSMRSCCIATCAGARQLQQLLGKTAEPLYLVNDTRCALCLLRADELCR
jgi:hypothetical protein